MTVMVDIDDEIQRTRDAISALKQIPRGETNAQACSRIAQTQVLRQRLDELSAERLLAKRFLEQPKVTERRAIVGELRAKGRRLEGYAAVFNQEAKIGSTTETIAPRAFYDTLTMREDILALVDHDPGRVLARTRSGTLRLAEDSHGLAFDLDVPATTVGSDVLALAERGDIGGASFAFTVKAETWDGARRTLEAVDLHEISIVSAWPAYSGTIVQARSKSEAPPLILPPRVAVARRYLDSL